MTGTSPRTSTARSCPRRSPPSCPSKPRRRRPPPRSPTAPATSPPGSPRDDPFHRRNNHPPTRRLNMATVYVPRLIESAAQAEALPEGSIVINDDGDRYSRHPRWGEWHSVADDRDLTEDLDSTFRPPTITALVPIEAEEQHVSPDAITYARYVTPWEEA